MKVLWLTVDRSQRCAQLFDPLRKAFGHLPDVELDVGMGGVWWLKDLARGRVEEVRLDPAYANDFDFIFCDAPFAWLNQQWDAIKTPRAFLIEDQHGPYVPVYVQRSVGNGFTHAMIRYWGPHEHQLGELLRGVEKHWLPHSVDPMVFCPYAWSVKKPTCLLSGSFGGKAYPIRNRIFAQCSDAKPSWFRRIERPKDADPGATMKGGRYAQEIGSCQAAFATGSIYGYVVAKYFEIPAVRTALVAEVVPELRQLGFKPGQQFVPLNPNESIPDQVDHWMNSPFELESVADAGCELVQSMHTVGVRAQTLRAQICRILSPTK